ncbi:probable chitinase 10 [Neocloeon triangulifer]|uniref:probable chitinase 10 n=1 Tax=Neocloeon triangulifer TaxID=2078957 RepID=UPI00286F7674|nr:probable chitinase 10 [Neocloeon triangulifer]
MFPVVKYDESQKKVVLMEDQFAEMKQHLKTFQKARLKVLITLGDWWNVYPLTMSPKMFSSVARNENNVRNAFVKELVTIVKNYNFDGINFRWTHPGSPYGAQDGFLQDKVNFVTLLKSFASALKPDGLLVTYECTAIKSIINTGIDIPKVAAALDYILIYATNYQTGSYITTGLITPSKEVKSTLEMFKSQVDDPGKIILAFKPEVEVLTLANPNKEAKIGSNIIGEKKDFTCWIEIMRRIYVTEKNNWVITKGTNESQTFACNGDKWTSFDDINAIKYRMELVQKLRLGGVQIMATFADDIFNELGCGPAPFLRTINEILRGYNDCILPSCP